MTLLLLVLGSVALVVAAVDLVWTVLAAGSGAGPLTGRLSRVTWSVALKFGSRPERPRHAFLAVFGVALVLGMLLAWVGVVYGAWWLISSAADGAVRGADGQPAGLLARAYFVGYNLFTLGTGTYVAGDGLWQVVPVATGANGLVFLPLGISYYVPLASAVGELRQLAHYIHSLGRTPDDVVTGAWTGKDFGSLSQHLVALTPMVHLATERHLTYPALAYFHSAPEKASSVSVVVLDDALTLLDHGVAPAARPDDATTAPLRRALDSFLTTVSPAFIADAAEPLPPPDLGRLRAAGIPTVSDDSFAATLDDQLERRRLLARLLADDGWSSHESTSSSAA